MFFLLNSVSTYFIYKKKSFHKLCCNFCLQIYKLEVEKKVKHHDYFKTPIAI